MFQEKNSLFFILGLSAFLLAHFFYIIYFAKQIKLRGGLKIKPFITILVLLYSTSLILLLYPKLGSLKIPVLFYTTIITTMLLAVFHSFTCYKTKSAFYCIIGAILFVVSDSLLAINKFHNEFLGASFLIMLTYGFAQYFLISGVLANEKS